MILEQKWEESEKKLILLSLEKWREGNSFFSTVESG
jgi:hypothetical protein